MFSASAQTAFNIVKEHPRVISDRVGLFGLSLGSIVSFSLAAESLVVKVLVVLLNSLCYINEPINGVLCVCVFSRRAAFVSAAAT